MSPWGPGRAPCQACQLLADLPALVTAEGVDDDGRRRLLQMLAYQVDGQHAQVGDAASFLQRLAKHPTVVAELAELGGLLEARSTLLPTPLPGLDDSGLILHARYGIREVLTAVGWLTAERRTPFQAGVLPLSERKTELLFVTLDKSEGYHDRIAYRDHAISAERFHWQTQNSAGPDTRSGRRYVESLTDGSSNCSCGPARRIRTSLAVRSRSSRWKAIDR